METELLKRITINPGIFNGKPIIRGMSFTVTDILDLLSSDMTPKDIIYNKGFSIFRKGRYPRLPKRCRKNGK